MAAKLSFVFVAALMLIAFTSTCLAAYCEYNDDCSASNSSHICCCNRYIGDPESTCGLGDDGHCPSDSAFSCTPRQCTEIADCGGDFVCCSDPNYKYGVCEKECVLPKKPTCSTGQECSERECCCKDTNPGLKTCKPLGKCAGDVSSCKDLPEN